MFRRVGFLEIAILGIFLVAMSLATDPVFASTGASSGGGSGLPIEMHVQKFLQSVSGPIANGFAIMMFICAAIRWHASHEFGAWGIGFLSAGILVSIVVAAGQLVSMMYSGAVI